MLSSFRAWHVCVSSWDTCWSVFTNSKWMNLLQVAAAGRLRSYRPVPSMVCCYLAGLHPCGLPLWSSSPPAWQQVMYKPCQPRLCLQTPACAVPFISSLLTTSISRPAAPPLVSAASRAQTSERLSLPSCKPSLSDITPTPLHPTCTFTSSLVHCAALGFWHQEFKPAHIHYFQFHLSTRLMFFYPFSLVFLHRHCSSVSVGITGHTDFICYSHPHFSVLPNFLTQHHGSCLSSIVYFL